MAALNRIPAGLLDFFGVKQGGWGPRELNGVLQPSLDLFRWYFDTNAQQGSATLAQIVASAGATNIPISSANWLVGGVGVDFASGAAITTVPQDELWVVLEAGMEWTFNAIAGGAADFALCTTIAGRTVMLTDTFNAGYTSSIAAIVRVGKRVLSRGPVFMLGGDQLQVFSFGAQVGGGGTIDLIATARIARFKR